MIAVKDSGIGISAQMLPKVFDLFTQVDTLSERPQCGLGIGQTLVKQLLELFEKREDHFARVKP
ncbi:MAG TPA: ATP-binding protein [Planctomycetota bacterium]|nr:ATP-binding protein [Planctomycetota bacterium]